MIYNFECISMEGHIMQIAKWGNSLAVRIPAAVVDALASGGDDVEIHVAGKRVFALDKKPSLKDRLVRLRGSGDVCLRISILTVQRPMSAGKPFFDTNVCSTCFVGCQGKKAETLLEAGG